MQEVFEKIIEKLEERTSFLSDCTKYGNKDAEQQNKSYSTMMMYEVSDLVDDLIEIVKQEAEKFGTDINVGSNGWISCNERLPEENSNVIACFAHGLVTELSFYDGLFHGIYDYNTNVIIAWQQLPQPYTKGE